MKAVRIAITLLFMLATICRLCRISGAEVLR